MKQLSPPQKVVIGIGAVASLLVAVWVLLAPINPPTLRPVPSQAASGAPGAKAEIGLPTAPIPKPGVEPLSRDAAMVINASIPISSLPNPPAAPFNLVKVGPADRANALICLTMTVYYEAGNQSADEQAAVAQVVLNRVRNPKFPKSICGVVFQGSTLPTGCQFTFTCDGSLARTPLPTLWRSARGIAERALSGYVQKQVGLATHYHSNWVVPYWQSTVLKVAQIGAFDFYRMVGSPGMATAFTGQYSGAELLPAPLSVLDIDSANAGRNDDGAPAASALQPVVAGVELEPAPSVSTPRHMAIDVQTAGAPVSTPPAAAQSTQVSGLGEESPSAPRLPMPSHW